MDAVFNVAVPVFALIFAGYVAAKLKLLGPASSEALNRFVYWFALPAVLFLVMFRVPIGQVMNPGFLAAFGLAGLATLAVTLLVGWLVFRLRPADLAVQSVTAIYGNVGYMGIPLCLMVFGQDGLPPAIAGTIITASIIIGAAVIVIESDIRAGAGLLGTMGGVGLALAKNPMLVAPAVGAALALSGVPLPGAVRNFGELLGAAASPCALFALGLFLASQPMRGDLPAVSWLIALKLLVMPLLTWLIGFHWLAIDPQMAKIALLLNALPTGAGAFVLAQQYDRLVGQTSASILLSTLLSVISVSFLIAQFSG